MTRAWLALLWALDLIDDSGQPDHGKVMGFVVLCFALIAHFVGMPIGTGQLIVLASCAYGSRVWLAFLKSKSVTATESVQLTQIRQEILTRREHGAEDGTEPTA